MHCGLVVVVKAYGKCGVDAHDTGSIPILAFNSSDRRTSTIFRKKGVLPLFAPNRSKDVQIMNISNRALSRAKQHLQLSQYMPLIALSQSPSADSRYSEQSDGEEFWRPCGQFEISRHYWQKSNKFLHCILIHHNSDLIKEPNISQYISCKRLAVSTTPMPNNFCQKSFNKW